MRTQHDIFNTPVAVKLSLSEQPTPSSYANYPEGRSLGKTMPMWRVQTEGYLTHPNQLIGIVSRDAGFLDSPDTEWISSGVNSKGPSAVALGRHGNFFHWGFAVSPTYLTTEAKDVFVNALHYIARFDRQAPIARKVQATMLRSTVDQIIDGLSEEGYARTVAMYDQIRLESEARNAEIQQRIDAGAEVSKLERQMLEMRPVRTPGRLDSVRRLVSPEQIKEFDHDPAKVSAYLHSNKPFLYPSGWYNLVVDEELKDLGTANSDINMLDQAVALLSSDHPALGFRLLERYTAESFATQAEWEDWLQAHRPRLFFSESCGYKWLVNTLGESTSTPAPPKATPRSPLATGLSLEPKGGGLLTLTVHIDILLGWHAYANVPANSAYAPLKLTLDLPDGVQQVGAWNSPPAHASIESPALTIFEGRLAFECELLAAEIKKTTEIACQVSYQVCNDQMCMPPTTKRLVSHIQR